jgi:DUF4097 and DUF4098 domain-containing protein YvlB
MKRGSLVGPLLLIGIGGLFLARNVFPDLPLLDYLARYWPVLLVVWGVLRLGEILVWTVMDHPLPARGLSGGEWMLVMFLCIFGVSLHAARGFYTWFPQSGIELGGLEVFGQSFEYPVSGEAATSKSPKIVIENFRGNARIMGADVQTVKVTGRNTVRSMDQPSAERANREAGFEVSGSGDQVTIKTNQNRVSGSLRITADLDITVPKGASVSARGRGGDFDIHGITGSVDIDSDSASVRLEDIGGAVRADLRGGDIVRALNVQGGVELKGRGSDIDLQNIQGPVTVNGNFSGVTQFHNLEKPLRFVTTFSEFTADKLPGDVRLTLGDLSASNLIGPVRFTSQRSWDIRLSGFTNSLEINDNGGDIDLRPGSLPLAKMDVHTHSGHIELALPEGAKFDLNATTNQGEISNDFGGPLSMEPNRRGRGRSLHGSNGGPQVTLTTDRGDIVVRGGVASDNEPAPRTKGSRTPVPAPSKPPQPVEQ